ncbi:MAG TPA: riboflavin biosynthesis protein RibF [Opitutaceae bacterium]|nr:riboflavin biosynthesis protein RibF [Opitutaceae bacterium]
MNLPRQFSSIGSAELPPGPVHLAIGMFDGVHLGHRAVISPAVAAARQDAGTAVVLTFCPHPSAIFRPERATRLIQDSRTKARVLGRLGVQAVITERFTDEFARIEAEAFLAWLKERLPGLVAVYVGDNFRFGHKRRGNLDLLRQSGNALGIAVTGAARVAVQGEPVSSTRIRAHLEAGEIEAANALLGYSYFAAGTVTPGKRLGRTLGFPTLNVPWAPDLRPRYGVYAVRLGGAEGEVALPGVANYGVRPTVETTVEPKLEIHVLGDCPFDAGAELTVEWRHFLRAEMKFGNVEELRTQIARDCEAAAAALRA